MRKKFIIISLALTILYIIFRAVGFGWIENVELVSLNFRLNLRGPLPHPDQVKIVAIDDRSLSELYYEGENPWPWRRSVYADVINKLGDAGVKSIIMDISFDTVNPNDLEGDRQFAMSLFTHPYVVIGAYLINNKAEYDELAQVYRDKLAANTDHLRFRYQIANPDRYYLPDFFSPYLLVPPEDLFMNSAWAYGNFEIGLPGEDGMYRTVPLVINEKLLNDKESASLVLLPNIDILGLTAYYGLNPGDYVLDLKHHKILIGDKRSVPIDENGHFIVNYYGKRAFPEVSVIDLMRMSPEEMQKAFKDRIVLIGYTAKSKGLFDLRPTPFNKNEAGVQIHATMLQNILDENFLKRAPFWINILLIFVLLCISAYLQALPNLRWSIISNLGFLGLYNVINYALFVQNIWVDLFYPDVALVTILLYNTISRVYQENRQRLQTKNFFEKYVPASVVEQILENPDLIKPGGEKMEITVLFSDIVGFTPISEALEPEELVRLLNEYFSEVTPIIKDQFGGTLDKFVGDAIVAIFGAPISRPDDPLRAVGAAVAMQEKVLELQERWRARGEKVLFNTGIGINSGQAIVGNIGSPDRLNYTCIGDTVNTAARLEAATRTTGAAILISAATYEQVKDSFECREIPPIFVKGKKDALAVYGVLGRKNASTAGAEIVSLPDGNSLSHADGSFEEADHATIYRDSFDEEDLDGTMPAESAKEG